MWIDSSYGGVQDSPSAFPRMPMDDSRKSLKDGILRMVLDLEKFRKL